MLSLGLCVSSGARCWLQPHALFLKLCIEPEARCRVQHGLVAQPWRQRLGSNPACGFRASTQSWTQSMVPGSACRYRSMAQSQTWHVASDPVCSPGLFLLGPAWHMAMELSVWGWTQCVALELAWWIDLLAQLAYRTGRSHKSKLSSLAAANHRFTEVQGWKGPCEIIRSTHIPKSKNFFSRFPLKIKVHIIYRDIQYAKINK